MADLSLLFEDALTYTKTGIYRQKDRWLKLILATILLGIPLYGYLMQIYRGRAPAPDVEDWGTLFFDGLKLVIIGLTYAIPVIIVSIAPALILNYGAPVTEPVGSVHRVDTITLMGPVLIMLLSVVLTLILEIIIAILLPVASIRFARSGVFSDAFRFGGIFADIRRIGWINYLISLFAITIMIGIPVFILEMIFLFAGMAAGNMYIGIGLFILLIILVAPVIATFQARFMTLVYDSASAQ
jgi:hypothetical protein